MYIKQFLLIALCTCTFAAFGQQNVDENLLEKDFKSLLSISEIIKPDSKIQQEASNLKPGEVADWLDSYQLSSARFFFVWNSLVDNINAQATTQNIDLSSEEAYKKVFQNIKDSSEMDKSEAFQCYNKFIPEMQRIVIQSISESDGTTESAVAIYFAGWSNAGLDFEKCLKELN